MGIAGVAVVLVCVVLPLRISQLAYQLVVYSQAKFHEKYLQTREMEYLLGLNAFFAENHMHLVSSFKRFCAYFWVRH